MLRRVSRPLCVGTRRISGYCFVERPQQKKLSRPFRLFTVCWKDAEHLFKHRFILVDSLVVMLKQLKSRKMAIKKYRPLSSLTSINNFLQRFTICSRLVSELVNSRSLWRASFHFDNLSKRDFILCWCERDMIWVTFSSWKPSIILQLTLFIFWLPNSTDLSTILLSFGPNHRENTKGRIVNTARVTTMSEVSTSQTFFWVSASVVYFPTQARLFRTCSFSETNYKGHCWRVIRTTSVFNSRLFGSKWTKGKK